MMAACFSDVPSEFRRLPHPVFWGNYGPSGDLFDQRPDKNPGTWAENTAGYLRGMACLAKKSCTGISAILFSDIANTPFVNPFDSPRKSVIGDGGSMMTRCLSRHLATNIDTPTPSEIQLTLDPKGGWVDYANSTYEYFCGAKCGIVDGDSLEQRQAKVFLTAINLLNREASAAAAAGTQAALITTYTGQGVGGTTLEAAIRTLQRESTKPYSVPGLQFAQYGGGGATCPSSKQPSRVSLQPLYTQWEYIITGSVDGETKDGVKIPADSRPDQGLCASSKFEAPPYQYQDKSNHSSGDYTSTMFRCALKHPQNTWMGASGPLSTDPPQNVTVSAQGTCKTGDQMFAGLPEWQAVQKENEVTNSAGQKSSFVSLLQSIKDIAKCVTANNTDKLLWQFSIEQDNNRVHDLCMGMLLNPGGCNCGEPNDLGILPLSTIIEWYNAVDDYHQQQSSSFTGQQYSGFYQLNLIPMHFLTGNYSDAWWPNLGDGRHFSTPCLPGVDTSRREQSTYDFYQDLGVGIPAAQAQKNYVDHAKTPGWLKAEQWSNGRRMPKFDGWYQNTLQCDANAPVNPRYKCKSCKVHFAKPFPTGQTSSFPCASYD